MRDDASAPQTLSRPPRQPGPSRFRRALAAACAVLLATLAGLAWLGGSASGLRFLCAGLGQLTAGRLQIEAPGGRLLDTWRVGSLRWHDATHDVELQQLAVAWSPVELLHGELVVERIEAASLRLAWAPSDAPPELPDSLQLPFGVRVGHLALGRVLLGRADEKPATLGEGIAAALASDGRRHRLQGLRAQLGKLALSADATLAGEAPFALEARAALSGAAVGQAFTLTLLGSGSLGQLQLDGKADATAEEPAKKPVKKPASAATRASPAPPEKVPAISGEMHGLLTLFSARPVASLRLQLRGLDPAAVASGAPSALLDVDALLESPAAAASPTAREAAAVAGHLSITNRHSGALDRQLLPVKSLQARLDWRGELLAIDGLAVALAGGGQLSGQGSFAGGQLALELAARELNARALHGSLVATRLAGPLRAGLGADSQTLELDLRDAHYAVNARASRSAAAIEVEKLQLSADTARLAANGRLALSGEGRFTAQGRLRNFDPARFLKLQGDVRSVLNAAFEARGALRLALELGLNFELRDSRIGTQKLAGRGALDLLGSNLRKADIDLEAAGNRVHAEGGFGQPGQTLRVDIRAPKLEALGWRAVAGDANGRLVFAGTAAEPQFSGELQATRLRLASLLEVQGLSFDGQLGAGPKGALAGTLHCTACALPAYGIPALAVDSKADGARGRHHLAVRVLLPKKDEVRLALDGGFETASRRAGAASPPQWTGTLSELRLGRREPAGAPPELQLAAPAPLRMGSAALAFGPAAIDGAIGSLHIERLVHEAGRWQSTGRLQHFRPQALLAEWPAASAVFGKDYLQSLQLGGEWDFTLGERMAGRAALWRESGDLTLGPVQLGFGESRLQATLDDGGLAVSAKLRGTRLGEIDAQLHAAAAPATPGGRPALIDAQAPWRGTLQARVPDLAWAGPLIGEGWQLAGQLSGEMRLGGSAAHPQFSGEWRGERLAARSLAQGTRLERGQLLLEVNPERLLLRRLSFESDFQPAPRELRLDDNVDLARLTATPGRVEASGELALAGATTGSGGRLTMRLDRLGVLQRPDQWVALSGDVELRLGERVLDAGGKLRVDAGFWSLAQDGRPRLSDDVVIRQPAAERGSSDQPAAKVPRALHLDLEASFGRSFYFRGAGLESRLAGQLRIRSDDAGLPRATGSIRTVEGRFDAYGQKLGIERGIVNFQGPLDNPGLNVLAVRKDNLPVEAGVEVTGTARRPVIRLVSTPEVPDAEKLSWLVLGRSPDQQGDSSLLLAAAQTMFGGQGGGTLGRVQRSLGIDEFGVSSGSIGGPTRLPTSRVASASGFGSSQTVSGQIVSVGKRLSSRAILSYEQSLNTTESIVKLTVNLNRQFSLVGRAGSDSAVDLFWNRSFGR